MVMCCLAATVIVECAYLHKQMHIRRVLCAYMNIGVYFCLFYLLPVYLYFSVLVNPEVNKTSRQINMTAVPLGGGKCWWCVVLHDEQTVLFVMQT